MAKLRMSELEYAQTSIKLKKLAESQADRSKGALNLIKQTAAKFSNSQLPYAMKDGFIEIPLQRRHLRLLEEMQTFSLTILNTTTIPELKSRRAKYPEKAEYYNNMIDKANTLRAQMLDLLNRIQTLL